MHPIGAIGIVSLLVLAVLTAILIWVWLDDADGISGDNRSWSRISGFLVGGWVFAVLSSFIWIGVLLGSRQ